jgi:hypothetical protein
MEMDALFSWKKLGGVEIIAALYVQELARKCPDF